MADLRTVMVVVGAAVFVTLMLVLDDVVDIAVSAAKGSFAGVVGVVLLVAFAALLLSVLE